MKQRGRGRRNYLFVEDSDKNGERKREEYNTEHRAWAQKMFAVKLNEKVYNFFNEIILCPFFRSINKAPSATIANKTNAAVALA